MPIAPVTTDLNDLEAEPDTKEAIAPVTTDPNDLKAGPETEEAHLSCDHRPKRPES